jgi:hypothetical protein
LHGSLKPRLWVGRFSPIILQTHPIQSIPYMRGNFVHSRHIYGVKLLLIQPQANWRTPQGMITFLLYLRVVLVSL